MQRFYKLLTVVLLSLMGTTAQAYDFAVDGIYYSIIDGGVAATYGDVAGMASYTGDVTIPATVTNGENTYQVIAIDQYAFYNCTELSSIVLPEGITSIGFSAFFRCSMIEGINIPAAVTTIGESAFSQTTSLKAINVASDNANYSSADGVLFNKDLTRLIACPCGKSGDYTVPSTVRNIGAQAFYYCQELTGIILNDQLTHIEGSAFQMCAKVESIDIPASVYNIGNYAFYSMSSLKAINVASDNYVYSSADGVLFNKDQSTLITCPAAKSGDYTVPSTVTQIFEAAFCNCAQLTGVTLPSNLVVLDRQAFGWCTALTSIEIPGTVETVSDQAFINCSNLSTVTLNEGIKEIGDKAFRDCAMSTLVLPASLTTIKANAFMSCPNLSTVKIPAGVTQIGDRAFAYCGWLDVVYSYIANPATCSMGDDVFLNSRCNTLYVRQGKLSLYQNAEPWCSAFTSIREMKSIKGDVNDDEIVDIVDVNCALNVILGTIEGETFDGRADVNGDGAVDITDVNEIINIILGIVKINTVAEVIAGNDGDTFAVCGVCTEIVNDTWGNWYLEDSTGKLYIYGTLDADGKTKNFKSLGIEVGDKVTVQGPKTTYRDLVELVNVTVLKVEKANN